MIGWFKKNWTKLKSDLQEQSDKKAGFKNAIRNSYYKGYEITMKTGEVLRMTREVHSSANLSRDRRLSSIGTTRLTFSVDKQKYFKDQIVKVRRFTEEEQPKWITKEEN